MHNSIIKAVKIGKKNFGELLVIHQGSLPPKFLTIQYSIECYDSLVNPQNLICKIYHGDTISKIFCHENYPLYDSRCNLTQ